MAESEEELKSLLMKGKEKSEKVVSKLNIQKTKIMASGPIPSWEVDGETVEAVSDFILGGSKMTADGDCSHEIKRRLLLGRKVMTNLDSILKNRDITLPTKVRLVKAMVFPVVMYGWRRQWHPTPVLLPGKSMDGGAWWAVVHGVTKSWTQLSDFPFTFTFMPWRRKQQPTLVFLPGESQGRGSLVGFRLWGRTESDTTEAT